MIMNPRRRAMTAVYISLSLNAILLFLGALSSKQRYSTSRYEKILDVLGGPGSAFADWLAPSGHGAAHFLGGALMSIGFSFAFYGVIAWVIISLPAWWRDRT
jgi:hypothetical protein